MENKTIAGLIHLLGLLNLTIVSIILWVMYKDKSDLVDQHGKTFLNLVINLFIAGLGLGVLYILGGVFLAMEISALGAILYGLAALASLVIGVYALIFTIKGTIAGFNEEPFQYPYIINILK